MTEIKAGWMSAMLTNLESRKIDTTIPTRENVVQMQPHQLSKLHDQARRARSNLVSIHAEGHALMMREEEARDILRRAQSAVIEAIGEIGIRGEIVEPSTNG